MIHSSPLRWRAEAQRTCNIKCVNLDQYFSKLVYLILRAVNSNGEDDHEDDTSKKAVLIVEGLGDSQKPLHGNDDQPHHGQWTW